MQVYESEGNTRYVEHLRAGVHQRYGLEVLYLGDGGRALVADEGQAWDTVVLVRYPSRQAFVDNMVRDPEYRAGAHLRAEALVESVLQPTVPAGSRLRQPEHGPGRAGELGGQDRVAPQVGDPHAVVD